MNAKIMRKMKGRFWGGCPCFILPVAIVCSKNSLGEKGFVSDHNFWLQSIITGKVKGSRDLKQLVLSHLSRAERNECMHS